MPPFRLYAWQMAGLAVPWMRPRVWWVLAAAMGVVPLLLGFALGSSLHQYLSATGLFVMLIAAVREQKPGWGMGALAVGFASHNAVAIGLSAFDPVSASACMPDGAGYLAAQLEWIRTGTDPEYDWVNWVPAHLHLLLGMTFMAVMSMGLLVLVQGMYEVDLMNFYVGNVIAQSDSASIALFVGWHPWSVVRGFCYVLLTYEVASLSLSLWSGRTLSTRRARAIRWAAALGFFGLDMAIKWSMLDVVRSALDANLSG
ncbi:MAG: hypothetical protein ACJAZO_004270 [Myxococcota bacterium]|jgi:hypothetical protein